jgi:hypothetical protein
MALFSWQDTGDRILLFFALKNGVEGVGLGLGPADDVGGEGFTRLTLA